MLILSLNDVDLKPKSVDLKNKIVDLKPKLRLAVVVLFPSQNDGIRVKRSMFF